MSRKLVIRPEADADLDSQALFIAIDNMDTALRLYAAARRAYEQLLEMPELGTAREWINPRLPDLACGPSPTFRIT